jgi:predicted small integral membrane protein
MTNTRWTPIYLTFAGIMGAILAFLLWAVPVDDDGAREWTGQLIDGFWMAWTFPAIRFPETPRVGILRIETTRGDRLFITLLGSAFIHLAWLFFAGPDVLWGALILSLVYAAAVFRWV